MKIAFFDRDGTIIEDYPDKVWSDIEQPVFIDGAIDILKTVKRKGYEIVIVTNQYIINEGYITTDQYHSITKKMISYLKNQGIHLLDIYYCPHKRS